MVFCLAVGCGGGAAGVEGHAEPRGIKTDASTSTRSDSKREKAREPKRAEEMQAHSGSEESVHVTAAPIPRVDLLAMLEQGIPRFLQNIKVEPWFSDGRFLGWQVVSLFPDDSRFYQSSVRPGDVVIDVNGRSIERPESLKVLWDGLASASNLSFTVFREGRTYVIDHEITD
jgi:type II secretory pathway component PulC